MRWTIGALGLIHDHVWEHVGALSRRDDVTLSVADPNAPLRERARVEFGIERLHDDYATLLDRERPDAVLIFTDNAGTADVVELAASHGRPMMLEKPLADSLTGAERIRVAANGAGLPVMLNWPTNWNPAIRHALRLARDGEIGDIFRFSFRGGHGGPRELGCSSWFCDWLYDPARNGAGAYIDYCGYGASMSCLLLGVPSRVQATIGRLQKEDLAVDDNAVLLLRYPRAMSVIEATWTAAGAVPDGGPTIWGNTGSLVVQRGSGSVGSVRHITRDNPEGRALDPPPLPEGAESATSYFLSCLAADRPFEGLVSLEIGRDTQEILEAGLRAARSGAEVSLPLFTG